MRISLGRNFGKNTSRHTCHVLCNSSFHSVYIRLYPQTNIKCQHDICASGVLWNYTSNVHGAPEALEKLRRLDKKVYLVTNNSMRKIEYTVEKARSGGLEINSVSTCHNRSILRYEKFYQIGIRVICCFSLLNFNSGNIIIYNLDIKEETTKFCWMSKKIAN